MPIAALYDIHGNLPALEAVLEDVRQAKVDRIVVGGDIVPGPMQGEALDLLLSLPTQVQFIQGNGEVAVLAARAGLDPYKLPPAGRVPVSWSAEQLSREEMRVMQSWPKTLRYETPGLGTVLFCHGTPRDENEIFTKLTPEQRLLPIFEHVEADIVVCGHTHMQFDRLVGNTRVVNAGSVGMPFGEPGAYWLLLSLDIELQRTEYDLAIAAERIGATPYPRARSFAEQYVLRPPSEATMLDAFSRAEVK